MKIDKASKPLPAGVTGEGTATAAARGKVDSPAVPAQSGVTNVTLGSKASQLSSIEKSMSSVPVVNAAKVAEIRQAISEGRFKVNPEAVAGRLLDTVRELIGGKAQ